MDEENDGGFDYAGLADLIGTGTTAALALYSGISGNPVDTYPVMRQTGLPAVATVPSGNALTAAGVLGNPWVLALGALALVALLWREQ